MLELRGVTGGSISEVEGGASNWDTTIPWDSTALELIKFSHDTFWCENGVPVLTVWCSMCKLEHVYVSCLVSCYPLRPNQSVWYSWFWVLSCLPEPINEERPAPLFSFPSSLPFHRVSPSNTDLSLDWGWGEMEGEPTHPGHHGMGIRRKTEKGRLL